MKTTVTIDATLVKELMEHYREKTKTAVVTSALEEQLRLLRLRQLAGLLGKVKVDEAALRRADSADLKRSDWLEGMGTEDG